MKTRIIKFSDLKKYKRLDAKFYIENEIGEEFN